MTAEAMSERGRKGAKARWAKKKNTPTRAQRAAKTRKKNAVLTRDAYRKGRRRGWKDILTAYNAMGGEEFQDWLYTLTGYEA
jgi:hypothetical protein